jgi:hypothetical protein
MFINVKMESDRLVIRPYQDEDAQEIFEMVTQKELSPIGLLGNSYDKNIKEIAANNHTNQKPPLQLKNPKRGIP